MTTDVESKWKSIKNFQNFKNDLLKLYDCVKEKTDQLRVNINASYNINPSNKQTKYYDSQQTTSSSSSQSEIEVAHMLNIRNTALHKSIETLRTYANNNPSIIVAGQPMSGKTSLINEVLEGEYLPQSTCELASNKVQITYGKEKVVHTEITDKHGNVNQINVKKLQSSKIPSEYIVSNSATNNPLLSYKAVVTFPNNFLKQGLDIVESSNQHNVNTSFPNLADFRSVLVIYVINSLFSLTKTDVDHINMIKKQDKKIKIIYLVNICGSTENFEESSNQTNSDKTKNDVDAIFNQLKSNNIFDSSVQVDNEKSFFSISLQDIHNARIKGGLETKSVDYFVDMKKFFLSFIAEQLDNLIITAAEEAESFQKEILQYCVLKANMISKHSMSTLEVSKQLQILQNNVSAKIQDYRQLPTKLFEEKLYNYLNSMENGALLTKLVNFEYSVATQELIRNAEQYNEHEKCQACIDEIKECIVQTVITEFTLLIKQELSGNEINTTMQTIRQLTIEYIDKDLYFGCSNDTTNSSSQEQEKQPENLYETFFGKTFNTQQIMTNELLHNDILSSFNIPENIYDEISKQQTITKQVNAIFCCCTRNKYDILITTNKIKQQNKLSQLGSENNGYQRMGSQSEDMSQKFWITTAGKLIFKEIDKKSLCSRIAKYVEMTLPNLQMDVATKFDKFKSWCDIMLQFDKKQKASVQEVALFFAEQYVRAVAIVGHYKFNNTRFLKILGAGAQGTVYEADLPKTMEKLAVKEMSVKEKDLPNLCMEIYYTKTVNHTNLLPIYGVKLFPETSNYKIQLFMPLCQYNCQTYLDKINPKLQIRLAIANQVASAIQYMHSIGLMHRDIKLLNVLISVNRSGSVSAHLVDYGLSKAMGLQNFSFVGSPVHMAPEIIRNRPINGNVEITAYDEKVDIFAFGVLLWYLVSGSSKHPQFVIECKIADKVLPSIVRGQRPERPREATNEMWNLMQLCWQQDPLLRPTIDKVINALKLLNHS